MPHTHFLYDNFGRQTGRILPLGQTEETHYDALGRTDWVRDLAGRTTSFDYDSLGRLWHKRFFLPDKDPATATPDKLLTYHYDELGRVDSIADSVDGLTSYQYDPEGRQTQVASPQGTIHYQYDTLGRPDRTWTSNTDVRYTYDELSRLATVTMVTRAGQAVAGATLDWYGQTISGETTRYRYDPVGNLDLIQQSNGVVSDYSYDPLNRLTDLVHFVDSDHDVVKDASEATLASFHYTLLADGNKSSATETDDQGITRTFHWTYDGLDRLTSEALDSTDTAQDYITTWSLDLVGNRLEQDTEHAPSSAAISQFISSGTGVTPDQTTTYSYDNNDRLLTETNDSAGTADDAHTVYSWTAGDQTGKTAHAGLSDQGAVTEQTTFTYNVQGRTASITVTKDGTTTQITYKYSIDGIRVEEATTVGGTTTTKTYLIDSNNFTGYAQVLEEFVNGQLAKTFTLGHDVLTQHDVANGSLMLLYDGHGSTRALLDAVAAVVQRYAYEAYGVMLHGQGLTALTLSLTALLYSGEMTDKLIGLQNLRDRLYNQSTGTFTQLDRYVGREADPASLHKYLYAGRESNCPH